MDMKGLLHHFPNLEFYANVQAVELTCRSKLEKR